MMRNFFCLSAGLALCGGVVAGERPAPQTVDNAIKVMPKRIAALNADGSLATAWFDYNTIATDCNQPLIFDSFEPGTDGFPIGGLDCGLTDEGSRWFFGSTFCNMLNANDMSYADLGTPATRIQLGWFWYVNGVGTSEQCFIAVQTYDTFDKTCAGPAVDGFGGGIILDFGVLDSGAGAGYYFTDVCLADAGLELPDGDTGDGKAAYEIILANDFDSVNNILTLATCGQPMLWGTEDDRPGDNNPIEWSDLNLNAAYDAPDECLDQTFGLCPDPLAAMYCAYGKGSGGECVTLNVPTLVAGSPATFSGSGEPGQLVGVFYAFSTGGPFSGQQGNFCAESELSPPTGAGQVGGFTTVDGSGNYDITVPVPGPAQGLTVSFQAFGDGTCPDPCDSAVTTTTVL